MYNVLLLEYRCLLQSFHNFPTAMSSQNLIMLSLSISRQAQMSVAG